jgi:hypothetical protein
MSVKNIATAVAIVVAFAATSVNASAQDIRTLMDGSSQKVMESRAAINDRVVVEKTAEYTDEVLMYDGNVTVPVRACTKDQASQRLSIGVIGRASVFAGEFIPAGGFDAVWGYRRHRYGVEGAIGFGHPDKQSDNQNKFIELDFRASYHFEVAASAKKHSQFYAGFDVSFKTRKDQHNLDFDQNGQTDFYWKLDAKTIGFHGSILYQYSPRMSSCSMFVEAFAGAQQNYKGNIKYTEKAFSGGGKKWYPEFGITCGVNFNVFNKKCYNSSLLKAGYTKKQIKAMSTAKNY